MSDAKANFKQQAGEQAASLVQSGMVVGLGMGSTAIFAIRRIADRLQARDLGDIAAIATSRATEVAACALGIPMLSDDIPQEIDLTIDGADEVDTALYLIKGGGGALVREKSSYRRAAGWSSSSLKANVLPALARIGHCLSRYSNSAGAHKRGFWKALALPSHCARFTAPRSAPIRATSFSTAISARSPMLNALPARWMPPCRDRRARAFHRHRLRPDRGRGWWIATLATQRGRRRLGHHDRQHGFSTNPASAPGYRIMNPPYGIRNSSPMSRSQPNPIPP